MLLDKTKKDTKKNGIILSVITINFNNAEGLNKTLSYLDKFDLPAGVEWIVIDGGSTDSSLEIIRSKDHLLSHWVSEPDNGIYPAMNKGISISNGDYLIYMNSGDQFVDGFLNFEFLNNDLSEDIVYGDCFVTQDHINFILEKPPKSPTVLDLYRGCICHQSAFIRRDLQQLYPYDEDMTLASTRRFFFEVLIKPKTTLKYLNKPVAIYDTMGLSSSRRQILNAEWQQYLEFTIPKVWLQNLHSLDRYESIIRNSQVFELIEHAHFYSKKKKIFELITSFLGLVIFGYKKST
jgi:glycosyltransferase involved in cell wall biosynthesis